MFGSRGRTGLLLIAVLFVLGGLAPCASASQTPIGSGDLPSAVTDRDGTTHLVWLESHGTGPDTIAYCRIPGGSTTCGSLQHLTPTCDDGTTAAWQHRAVGGDLDGDRPKVMVSPFGDVYIVAHGLCSWDWGTSLDPWHSWHAINREILLHSGDGGDTFTSISGQARAKSERKTTADVDPLDTSVSASVYDAVNSRVVTAEYAPGDSQALDQFGSDDGVTPGIIVLGRQDQLGVQDPNPPSVAEMQKGVLSPLYLNNQSHVGLGPPSLVQRGPNAYTVAYAGQGSQPVLVRNFDCSSCASTDISDSSHWGSEFTVPSEDVAQGDEIGARQPKLVGGPAGTFLFYRDDIRNGDYQVFVRKLDGTAFGDRHLVLDVPTGQVSQTNPQWDAVEDGSTGRLTVVFSINPTDGTSSPTTTYTTSDDAGVTWSTPSQVASFPANAGNVFGVGTDTLSLETSDAGFTGLLIHTGTPPDSSVPDRPIYVDALPGSGTGGGTGGGGGGGGTGGGGTGGGTGGGGSGGGGGTSGGGGTGGGPSTNSNACKIKQFGPLDIIADACLEVDPSTGAVTAHGHVKVNGLELAGASIRFDARARTVTSTGPVTFSVGDTELFRAPINWTLQPGNVFTLPSVDLGGLAGKLEGFPVKGTTSIKLIRGGVEMPLHLALPSLFGGVTGDVTLRADNVAGIHLKDLNVSVPKALIGPLELDDMHFSYDPDQRNWDGGGTLKLPPSPPAPALKADVGFVNGGFDHASGELTFPGEGLPLDSFDATHITKIRFSLAVNPALKLGGGVTFTAGPKFGDIHVAQIDGDMTFTFPNGQPAILRADGTLELMTIPVANAFMQFKTDGQVSFGGALDYSIGDFRLHAGIKGWVMPPTKFSVDGSGRVCLGDLGCAGGEAVISSVGMAACAHVLGVDFGAGYKWGPSALWGPAMLAHIHFMFTGCSVADYQPAGAGAAAADAPGGRAAASSRGFDVGPNLPFMVVSAVGATAPPHVALSGPGHARIVSPVHGPLRTGSAVVFHVAGQQTTFFVVKHPAAGRWRITALPDSAPLVGAGHADGLPTPSIHARVLGHGATRTLVYRIRPLPGQTVTFEEHGRSGSGFIGAARRLSGRMRFTPAYGAPEGRTIVALVTSYGKPRGEYRVATYRSPAPQTLPRPRRFLIARRGTQLRLSWKRVPGVARYVITLRLSDGRVLALDPGPKRTAVAVNGIARGVTATGTLRAESSLGILGKPAAARLGR